MSHPISGMLEIDPKGFGFIRDVSITIKNSTSDIYVPPAMIQKHRLRTGVFIKGKSKPSEKGNVQLSVIESVNDTSLEEWVKIPEFSSFQPIKPNEWIRLEGKDSSRSMRIVDLFCPIGKGQRALIVAPPKAGKTRLMQDMAHAISVNHPDIALMVLLIDERPEEVTDMQRTVKGEVFASSSDSQGGQHMRLAQLVLEYAKRKVEAGKDVALLLDSLTRLGRVFNVHQRGSGRTMSGGVDIRALEIPKRLFGAARNVEHGGSLTIIATALIETNSRMDELIFQEFKGTGNMELVLNRELADQRIFPAIDLNASGTRDEELLFGPATDKHYALRRALAKMLPKEAMSGALDLIRQYPTNELLLNRFKS